MFGASCTRQAGCPGRVEDDRDFGCSAGQPLVLGERASSIDRDALPAPPKGMFTTAHFEVIHIAGALTSSIVTPRWTAALRQAQAIECWTR
jgi:hypothetical protein